jgi:hypothetical protein
MCVADGFEGMDKEVDVCAKCYAGKAVAECERCSLPLCDECLYGDVCLECLEEEVLGE